MSLFYRYFCGNYHFFDLFGKWYGKKKNGMVKMFDCLIVWGRAVVYRAAAERHAPCGRPSVLAALLPDMFDLEVAQPAALPITHRARVSLRHLVVVAVKPVAVEGLR